MSKTADGGQAVETAKAEPPPESEPQSVPAALQDSAPGFGAVIQVTPADKPWTNSRFWILQLVILALSLIRLAATVAFHLDTTSLAVEFSTLALFLVPVMYASLNYGFTGAIFTAGWVTLLAAPRFVSAVNDHNYVAAWAEVVQVVLLDALACLVGQRVTAERDARRLAESAQQAHLSAEAIYRDLFDSNQAPILIVDGSGSVIEANASAQRVFGTTATPSAEADLMGRKEKPARLVDMIGADAAGQVLSRLIAEQLPHTSTDGDRSGLELVQPVALEIEGHPILFRPTATMLGPADRGTRMQVVFEDVTAETRRHDLMEAYAARVVLGQEEERRHLAQELHDGPLQSLIHLCRLIDELESKGGQGHRSAPALSDLRVMVEDTVVELRSIARGSEAVSPRRPGPGCVDQPDPVRGGWAPTFRDILRRHRSRETLGTCCRVGALPHRPGSAFQRRTARLSPPGGRGAQFRGLRATSIGDR